MKSIRIGGCYGAAIVRRLQVWLYSILVFREARVFLEVSLPGLSAG